MTPLYVTTNVIERLSADSWLKGRVLGTFNLCDARICGGSRIA